MRRNKRPFHFFLLALLLGIIVGYTIYSYPPDYTFALSSLHIPLFPFVALGAFLCIFFFISYLAHSSLQGAIFSIFVSMYFAMRFFAVTHIFFLLLLVALFFTTELFFFKRK